MMSNDIPYLNLSGPECKKIIKYLLSHILKKAYMLLLLFFISGAIARSRLPLDLPKRLENSGYFATV